MPFLIAQTFVLLLAATAIGLLAGWLIWGGTTRSSESFEATDSADLATLRGEVEARNGDVARLRRKLKRAVEELESHAAQLESAEERLASFAATSESGTPITVTDPALVDEVTSLQQHVELERQMRMEADGALASLTVEHRDLGDQLRLGDARITALETELAAMTERIESADDAMVDRAQLSVLEEDLREAHVLIKDAADRVSYLERQALLWQNEADRLQAVIDEAALVEMQRQQEEERQVQILLREHETALASLRMEASSTRLRADAAADHLRRLKSELRAVQLRSAAHVESTRSAMAELDHQLAVAQATLNDSAAPVEREQVHSAPDPTGLLALPGMTNDLITHLHELGVGSLTDISRWSPDDVSRIAAWLPENPDIITTNDWVASARALLAGGTVVPSTDRN